MANKRISSSNYIERARRRHGSKFRYDKTVYTTKRNKVIITCPKHGDFEVCPQHFLRSVNGCKRCGNILTKEEFLEKAKAVHGDRYDYSNVDFVNSTTKVGVICPTHGEFMVKPYEHYSKQVGCGYCFRDNDRLSTEDFVRQAREIHGDFYDYSQVEYKTADSLITIVCPTHGSFRQKPRVHSGGSGCKQCYLDRNRSNKEEFIKQAREVHGDRYDYRKVVYHTNKDKVEILCDEHGVFWVTPNGHTSSNAGCPRCKESKGETRVRVFLEKHGINYVQEYKLPTHRYRYDFFLVDHGILIEYQGQQHFMPVELFGGKKYFKETYRNDIVKKTLAQKHGYPLLTIGYWLAAGDGIEIVLENVLRVIGHVFDENLTITNKWSA